jgi:hypothetical protein
MHTHPGPETLFQLIWGNVVGTDFMQPSGTHPNVETRANRSTHKSFGALEQMFSSCHGVFGHNSQGSGLGNDNLKGRVRPWLQECERVLMRQILGSAGNTYHDVSQ